MKYRYQRVAIRSLQAADAALAAGAHEKASFLSYHAFESTGSALGTHMGHDMGQGVSHPNKIRRFKHAAGQVGITRAVAELAVRLAPMRNKFLYPELKLNGDIVLPEAQISAAKAAQLTAQVKHVVNIVGGQL